jgi:glutathione S-transferase
VLLPIGRIIHATNSPIGLPPNPPVAEHFRKVLPEALRVLDTRLSDGRPFVAGDQPSIADCTLAAALQFARFGKVEIDPAYQRITQWDTRYRERPAAKSILIM